MEWTTPSFAEIVEHALVYKQVKVKVSSSILYSSVFFKILFEWTIIQDDQSLLTYGETKLKIPNMGVQKRDCSR